MKKKATKRKAEKARVEAPPEQRCFRCNGTGMLCNNCGESPGACECELDDTFDCEDCGGTGVAGATNKPSPITPRRRAT